MPWFLLVLLLLVLGLLASADTSQAFQLLAPEKKASLDTPLSATLTWEAVEARPQTKLVFKDPLAGGQVTQQGVALI